MGFGSRLKPGIGSSEGLMAKVFATLLLLALIGSGLFFTWLIIAFVPHHAAPHLFLVPMLPIRAGLVDLDPLGLLLAGGFVVFFIILTIVKWRLSKAKRGSWKPRLPARRRDLAEDLSPSADVQPVILTPRRARVGKLALVLTLAVLWNGIVSVFSLMSLIKEWQRGNPDHFQVGLFVLFLAIGLLFIGMVFYCVMILRNPSPHAPAQRRPVSPGGYPGLDLVVLRPRRTHPAPHHRPGGMGRSHLRCRPPTTHVQEHYRPVPARGVRRPSPYPSRRCDLDDTRRHDAFLRGASQQDRLGPHGQRRHPSLA